MALDRTNGRRSSGLVQLGCDRQRRNAKCDEHVAGVSDPRARGCDACGSRSQGRVRRRRRRSTPGSRAHGSGRARQQRRRLGTRSRADSKRPNTADRAGTCVLALARPCSCDATDWSPPHLRRTRVRGAGGATAPAADRVRSVGPPHHGSAASARNSAAQHCCVGTARNQRRGVAQGTPRQRHRVFAALCRDDLGNSIRGLRPHVAGPERTDRDWGADRTAMGATGADLHIAGRRLRLGHLAFRRAKSCGANHGQA